MKSIYSIGDINGKLSRFNVSWVKKWTGGLKQSSKDENFVIVTGDLGLVTKENFDLKDNESASFARKEFKFLHKKPFTILFLEGETDWYEKYYKHSITNEMYMGGKVHKFERNVYHLRRGEIYQLNNFKIFAFGGSFKKLDEDEYIPTEEEVDYAIENLKKHKNKVDAVYTHFSPVEYEFLNIDKPKEEIERRKYIYDKLVNYIKKKVKFKYWYYGSEKLKNCKWEFIKKKQFVQNPWNSYFTLQENGNVYTEKQALKEYGSFGKFCEQSMLNYQDFIDYYETYNGNFDKAVERALKERVESIKKMKKFFKKHFNASLHDVGEAVNKVILDTIDKGRELEKKEKEKI